MYCGHSSAASPDGISFSKINDIFLHSYYFTTKDIQIPESSKPYLYLIVKGMLRLHTISGILDYVPGQYSLSDIDSPLSGQCITASTDSPFIAVQIEMSIDDVISVMLDIDDKSNEKIFEGQIPQKFKYAVGMKPLQCQKRLRLTEARRLMLDEDKKVADAAMEV